MDIDVNLFEAIKARNEIIPISKEFSKLNDQSNASKVRFVKDLLESYQQIPAFLTFIQKKSNQKSENLRKRGNEYFSLKNYIKALDLYNESLCYAENGSEAFAIGYANRSAVYFELKLYDESLQNIQWARENNYPERLMHKLEKREKDCLDMRKICKLNNTEIYIPKLSYDAHPKVPFITNCLELCENEQYGRHIITNKKLFPGDIIAIEKPFCTLLNRHLKYQRCDYCLQDHNQCLVPCAGCTQVMYCSEECQQLGFNEFHKYECSIIDILYKVFDKIQMIGLRTVITAFNCFESVPAFKAFIQETEESTINAFTIDYEDQSGMNKYAPIHTLATNQKLRTISDLFQRATYAAIAFLILKDHSELGKILATTEDENLLMELIYRHLQTAPTNMHSLDLIETADETVTDTSFGSGAYAFCSLLDHSCAPNITRNIFGKSAVVIVLKTIKKGQQILDNYGYHHCLTLREHRQKELLFQYHFQCTCLACQYNYPTFQFLPIPIGIPDCLPSEIGMEKMVKFDKEYAKENIDRFSKFLRNYAKFYPAAQLCRAEEYFKYCVQILANNIPMQIRYK